MSRHTRNNPDPNQEDYFEGLPTKKIIKIVAPKGSIQVCHTDTEKDSTFESFVEGLNKSDSIENTILERKQENPNLPKTLSIASDTTVEVGNIIADIFDSSLQTLKLNMQSENKPEKKSVLEQYQNILKLVQLIPTYDGSKGPDSLNNLKIFLKICSDTYKFIHENEQPMFLSAIIGRLRGDAFVRSEGKSFESFKHFKEYLLGIYTSHSSPSEMIQELNQCKQKITQSVKDFGEEIKILEEKIQNSVNNLYPGKDLSVYLAEINKQIINTFILGLRNPNIQNILVGNTEKNIDQLIKMAVNLEKFDNLKSQRILENTLFLNNIENFIKKDKEDISNLTKLFEKTYSNERKQNEYLHSKCQFCQRVGHSIDECRTKQNTPFCTRCHKYGHRCKSNYAYNRFSYSNSYGIEQNQNHNKSNIEPNPKNSNRKEQNVHNIRIINSKHLEQNNNNMQFEKFRVDLRPPRCNLKTPITTDNNQSTHTLENVVHINLIGNNPYPIVNIPIDIANKNTLKMLIDTGSDISLINVKSLKPETLISTKYKVTIKGINEQIKYTLGTSVGKLFNKDSLVHNFQIIKDPMNMEIDGILGRDFLQNRSKILFDTKYIEISTENNKGILVPFYNKDGEYYETENIITAKLEGIKFDCTGQRVSERMPNYFSQKNSLSKLECLPNKLVQSNEIGSKLILREMEEFYNAKEPFTMKASLSKRDIGSIKSDSSRKQQTFIPRKDQFNFPNNTATFLRKDYVATTDYSNMEKTIPRKDEMLNSYPVMLGKCKNSDVSNKSEYNHMNFGSTSNQVSTPYEIDIPLKNNSNEANNIILPKQRKIKNKSNGKYNETAPLRKVPPRTYEILQIQIEEDKNKEMVYKNNEIKKETKKSAKQKNINRTKNQDKYKNRKRHRAGKKFRLKKEIANLFQDYNSVDKEYQEVIMDEIKQLRKQLNAKQVKNKLYNEKEYDKRKSKTKTNNNTTTNNNTNIKY